MIWISFCPARHTVLHALAPIQKLAIFLQTVPEQSPLSQKCFVDKLDVVARRDQKASGHQLLHNLANLLALVFVAPELIGWPAPPRIRRCLAIVAQMDQIGYDPEHQRPLPGCDLAVLPISPIRERAGDAENLVPVGLVSQDAILAKFPQLSQGELKQG